MGLWYLKDSIFELIAFLDADHRCCLDTCKSTSSGIQFLGDKLVSWSSKKQDCTAMSTAEAENPDIGKAVEYQKNLLTSLDMSALDKPHLQLENLSRRFIYESSPDDAGTNEGLLTKKFIHLTTHAEGGILDLNNAAETLDALALLKKGSRIESARRKGVDASKPEELKDDTNLLQAEVQRLTMEESKMDERIREMQERIRDMSEDDNKQM
ncbi:transcription factor E2FA-like protein isoform X1 [Tanacetum coccineum]